MKKLNIKGFTMVELLAAITIMGIMMLIAGAAVTVYLNRSRENAYVTMALSAKQGAEEYIMEYPGNALSEEEYKEMVANGTLRTKYSPVTFDELTSLKFMSNPQDPANSSSKCTGRVIIYLNSASANNERALDSYSFVVHECCAVHKVKYTYSQKYINTETGELCGNDAIEDCTYIEDNSEEIADVWCDEE